LVESPTDLGETLDDVGSKLSDVLLSDAVLFVEGPTDTPVLSVWAEKLGWSLTGRNLGVLETGGAESVRRDAPIRSTVLENLAKGTSVPHLFLIDRDQRTPEEIVELKTKLNDQIHVLQKRELENYLLIENAILIVLRDEKSITEELKIKRQEATSEQISHLIDDAVEDLFGSVLIKRIRQVLGGLQGGFLNRDEVKNLTPLVGAPDFENELAKTIKSRVLPQISKKTIVSIAKSERRKLNLEWKNIPRRREIAPGADILEYVFKHFGARFDKKRDGTRLATAMRVEDIPDEIRILLERINNLTN
jgi:hypothetical protein